MSKRIAVTGGEGFVGRHFIEVLKRLGHKITSIDIENRGHWKRLGVAFVHADLRDYLRSRPTSEFDTVIHCAAVVGGRLHIENHPIDVATDLAIDSDLFAWIVKPQNIKTRLIYFSSSAAYPLALQTQRSHFRLREDRMYPLADLNIGEPDMTYGWVKLSGEVLTRFAVEKYGADVRIYRPFGGYGEDQDFTYPFPSIIQRIINRENPVAIWGSGKQERDFIHIDDVVNAVLATEDVMKSGEALNLGLGIPISFEYLALRACELLGQKFNIKAHPEMPEGVFSRVADVTKLNRWYTPEVSLDAGILRVAQALSKGLDRNHKTA